ncbi:MAG: hypothetical protein QOF95_1662 [Pseudonocardiales bacterium]|nr:hypothetical protein [Pseudonocardiales bacterium]
MTDPDKQADEAVQPYGPAPMRRALRYFHREPALGAVIVELLFVVIFCNQWMVNHVVVPWESSASALRQGIAPGLGAFAWSFAPVLHGYYWIWAGGIVHVLVWPLVTFLLVRVSVRTREVGARFIATIGSVVIAAIAALVAQRLVVYPDLSRLQDAATKTHQAGPGLVPWLFFGTVPGGSVMLVLIVAALAAIASGRLAIPDDDEDEAGDGRTPSATAVVDGDPAA